MNGVSMLGCFVFVAGWIMLTDGSAVSLPFGFSGFFDDSFAEGGIINIHLLSIAENLIFSGAAIAIFGALLDLRARPSKASDKPKEGSQVRQPAPMTGIPLKSGEVDGRQYTIFDNGSVELTTLTGVKRFPNMAAALDYIGKA